MRRESPIVDPWFRAVVNLESLEGTSGDGCLGTGHGGDPGDDVGRYISLSFRDQKDVRSHGRRILWRCVVCVRDGDAPPKYEIWSLESGHWTLDIEGAAMGLGGVREAVEVCGSQGTLPIGLEAASSLTCR